jgi:ABC-2 type transport system ATP-binding protein
MIDAHGLVKRYGSTMAVNDLSFSIRPGVVTGFLGPNGAGKTTTMRMILGLDAPTQGSVTVGGRSYRDLPAPMREVGALLDAKALHGGRRALAAEGRTVLAGRCPARSTTRKPSGSGAC